MYAGDRRPFPSGAAAKITSEGLAFHAVRPDVSLHDNALLAYVMDARRGSERVLRYISSGVRESYEDTLPAVRQADLIVTHPITFGAVLAAEKLGVPWISSVLAPISFLSAWDPPVPAPVESECVDDQKFRVRVAAQACGKSFVGERSGEIGE